MTVAAFDWLHLILTKRVHQSQRDMWHFMVDLFFYTWHHLIGCRIFAFYKCPLESQPRTRIFECLKRLSLENFKDAENWSLFWGGSLFKTNNLQTW